VNIKGLVEPICCCNRLLVRNVLPRLTCLSVDGTKDALRQLAREPYRPMRSLSQNDVSLLSSDWIVDISAVTWLNDIRPCSCGRNWHETVAHRNRAFISRCSPGADRVLILHCELFVTHWARMPFAIFDADHSRATGGAFSFVLAQSKYRTRNRHEDPQ
jgi:hypothetical protein